MFLYSNRYLMPESWLILHLFPNMIYVTTWGLHWSSWLGFTTLARLPILLLKTKLLPFTLIFPLCLGSFMNVQSLALLCTSSATCSVCVRSVHLSRSCWQKARGFIHQYSAVPATDSPIISSIKHIWYRNKLQEGLGEKALSMESAVGWTQSSNCADYTVKA